MSNIDEKIVSETAKEQSIVAETNVKTKKTKKHNSEKEPFLRLAKRDQASFGYRLAVRLVAIIVAFLLVMWFICSVSEFSFATAWKYMTEGAFGNAFYKKETFKNMMVLLCIGIALAPAYKMKFWNIGAQGQLLIGAVAASILAWNFGGKMSNGGLLFLMFLVSVIAGGLWAVIPAIFKVKINANETLFTLMMNYIAIQITASLVDKWKGKNSALGLFNGGFLPDVFGNNYGFMFLVVPLLAIFLYFYMKQTKHGYEISIVGESLNTAKYAGINTGKVIARTIFLSGAICGFVGFTCVGNAHSLSTSMGGSYGFTAIIVAWAAHFDPLAMALVSFGIVFLETGTGGVVNACSNLNSYVSYIVVAIFLLILIGCEFFINYRMIFNSKITARFALVKEKRQASRAKFAEKHPKFSSSMTSFANAVKGFFLKIAKFVNFVLAKVSAFFAKINLAVSNFFLKLYKAIGGFFAKLFKKGQKYKNQISSETKTEDDNKEDVNNG